ncbi:hypothetical protein D3C80_580400 [compost metagenome]
MRRQVGVDFRRNGCRSLLVRHAVIHLQRQLGLIFSLARECDEIQRRIFVLGALEDHPAVDRIHAFRPDQLEILAFRLVDAGDAAVIDRGDGNFAGCEILHRLRTGFPPDDIRLQLVELLEGAVDAFIGRQDVIKFRRLHAIGQKREFEIVFGALAQRTLARKLLRIPEIDPVFRAVLELVAVISHRQRPVIDACTALVDGFRQELVLDADLVPVELFVKTIGATKRQLFGLDLHDVPVRSAGLHLGLQNAVTAVPAFFQEWFAGLLRERLEIDVALRRLRHATPADNRQVACICLPRYKCRGGKREHAEGCGLEEIFHFVPLIGPGLLSWALDVDTDPFVSSSRVRSWPASILR